MEFSINKSVQLLEKTPQLLSVWLDQLDDEWILNNEGGDSWNIKEILAHLIVCEKTNWIPRAKIILANDPDIQFTPIDMTAHLEAAKINSITTLLAEFSGLREVSLKELQALNLQDEDLRRTAVHPVLEEINLAQLIATWVNHDLSHIAQISRMMAMQYKEAVGPFIRFLKFIQNN